ncbi:MAG TPA: hypothetical protein VKV16_08045, partial [Solirubrobacteraceae bacterium]|nr:hypothetical protein [Solirubrobacteraceae bacterium]
RDGAQLDNAGTFEDDSYDPGCGYGFGGSSINDDGGATPSITNTGTFLVDAGSQTIGVQVPFDNSGAIDAESGTLDLRDGGIPEHVAVGSWKTEGTGAIVLSGGEFLIAEAVDLADVRVEGATVTRVPVFGPPRGSLNPHPYASGGVTISGSGEAIGSGFSAATIEITPAGRNEWKALCGPLTPGLMGSFGCEWNTAAPGLYPDGHYQLRAQLSDSSEPPNTAPTSAIAVLVDNTPPAGSLTAPSGPLSGASMVSGSATDSGSGVASWQLQIAPEGSSEWSDACPAQVKAASGHTYECPLETTSYANGSYELRALITDNAGNTYATTPEEATIDNTAPANTTAPAISGSAEDGQTLSASAGSWSGTQPISYAYQWQSCNSAGEACTNISGANEATYVLGHGAVGATLRVTVTATNVEGASSASSAPTSVVVALPPSDATPPSISGVAQEGQTLTAGEGTWDGTPPLTYSYQWQQCDSTGASCVAIEGATEATLTLAAAQVGHTIRVEVTATNSVGSSSSVSAPSAVVVVQLPLETVAPSIGGSAVVGATLTAENGVWYGAKPITYAYQWESCTASGEDCAPVEGATGSSFTPSAAEIGHAIRLLVTATNSLGTGEATSATTAAVEGYAGGSACSDTWTGAAGDGSWDTARNWASGSVPSTGDHVCIPSGASVTASGSGDQAGWITDEGTLAIVYGSLTVNGPGASTFEDLQIEHGTLTGAGEVTIGSSLTAGDYGTIAGSGAFTIEHGASGTITPTGGDGVYLSERTLTNDGTLTVERGSGLSGSNHA